MSRLRRLCQGVSGTTASHGAGLDQRQGGAGGSNRLHRPWCMQSGLPVRCDHAGVRHRAARPRYSGAQAEFRIQRAGHLHRRGTRRHGAHQECADAGPAGARVDRQSRRETHRRARCADRRRGTRGPCRLAHRQEDGPELPDHRAGIARRRRVSVSARQAGDDRAGGSADHRQGAVSQYLQGNAAEILDRCLQQTMD